jgi:hypothetical protein
MEKKTYCPTNKNPRGMMMVFYTKHKRCFHADGFPFEKYFNALPSGQINPQPIHAHLN